MSVDSEIGHARIRNFSIIAHIDHGKSTLSDRLIQKCGGLSAREMSEQVLDSMDLERERGITIKSQSVTLYYRALDGQVYQLNLIDTPGHVDFSYEVSRSLAACEGALLVVDASQGVEAQTVANCCTAVDMGLEVVPVLNKIDLPTAEPVRVSQEIEEIIGIDGSEALCCSAKTGVGISELLENIIRSIPPPGGSEAVPLQALIIDSWFDNYLGVVSLVRVKNGTLKQGDKLLVMSSGRAYMVARLGVFTPKRVERKTLGCGEVGWVSCGIKEIQGAPVGDTLTSAYQGAMVPLPGFQRAKPQVYAGFFPMSSEDYDAFRTALEKLSLNDASLVYEPETSTALGFGFRCGFLGLLHMEIIQARLEREYQLSLIVTAPSVVYRICLLSGEVCYIDNPAKLPPMQTIQCIEEPVALCRILAPKDSVGNIISLCASKRGIQGDIVYHEKQVSLTYHIPLGEVVIDLFDHLKSASKGYASLDYAFHAFQPAEIVRVDILVNGDRVDALASFVHKANSQSRGRRLVEKLQEMLPRQQFDIAIQAAIGAHIIARATIKQYRKNVTSRCHGGGDPTRKQKLLKLQKEGKKRMKSIGSVEIPQEAFLSILNVTGKSH